MRRHSVTACLFLFATGASAATPIRLANHRAVYDLSLAESGGTRAVESARGRIVIEFTGDACKGYTMQTRQVTVLESGETGSRTSDLRNTTFESGDGKSYRFKTSTTLNGTASPSVDGTAESASDTLKVRLKEPKRDQFQSSHEVLFPTFHMRRLIQAARDGQTTLSVKVFDGSDDGRKVYDTLAVIGRQAQAPAPALQPTTAPERDRPLKDGAMAAMPHWPVTLSYFTQGEGERTPIYTLTFDLYENGVSGALRLDYGEFAVIGNMSRLDTLPSGSECAP
ncbi:cell envelope integrity EipB family protein [Methylobacterium sp. BTF04]|uniref:cell envelope integrity EipB family protein n=1 Tax=Methylobacterium sp. BTF04 TaxID=2708300 RepID=UPI0013CFB69E|nr:cell envelope integrity EipB family protein [Methylobacterium sp. BTF04]NEU13723.1 cell envelope integrity EipB family protein [Methylobacterium sp. BTF04]